MNDIKSTPRRIELAHDRAYDFRNQFLATLSPDQKRILLNLQVTISDSKDIIISCNYDNKNFDNDVALRGEIDSMLDLRDVDVDQI